MIIEGCKPEMLVPCDLFNVYSSLSNVKFVGVPTAKLKQRSDAHSILDQYLQHKTKTKCKLHCKKISYDIWLVLYSYLSGNWKTIPTLSGTNSSGDWLGLPSSPYFWMWIDPDVGLFIPARSYLKRKETMGRSDNN